MFCVGETHGGRTRVPYPHESWRRLLTYCEMVDVRAPLPTISLARTHTIAIGEDGVIQSWGFDPGDGRMGHGSDGVNRFCEWDGSLPQPIPGIFAKVVTLATGPSHGVAVTDQGEVYTWGSGTGDPAFGGRGGQLGHGSLDDVYQARQLSLHGVNAVACSAGSDHTVVLSDGGLPSHILLGR